MWTLTRKTSTGVVALSLERRPVSQAVTTRSRVAAPSLPMLAAAVAALAYSLGPAPLAPRAAPSCRAHVCMEEGVASLPPTAGQKTWFPKAADMAADNKKWYVVDAEGLRLGRMASECAKILIGKDKPTFTPGADVGDNVIIVNCEKVIVTGKKAQDKLYRRHSGRPGGMKVESYEELQVRPRARPSPRASSPPAPPPSASAAPDPPRRHQRVPLSRAPTSPSLAPGPLLRAHRRRALVRPCPAPRPRPRGAAAPGRPRPHVGARAVAVLPAASAVARSVVARLRVPLPHPHPPQWCIGRPLSPSPLRSSASPAPASCARLTAAVLPLLRLRRRRVSLSASWRRPSWACSPKTRTAATCSAT